MIRLLQRLDPRFSRLLDVGCGFGFTLDYWCHSNYRSGVGLEASGYGALGRELLGVDIRSDYLSSDTRLSDGPFDCVFASEVLEHVLEPKQFILALKAQLSEDGVLILTTPHSGYVKQSHPTSVVLAALFPGVHTVLFSKSALEQLLKDAGFLEIDVSVATERLIAYASNAPLKLGHNPGLERQDYINYLCKRSGSTTNADLELGYCYRAAKELVNSGDLDAAIPFIEKYVNIVNQAYRLDCYNPEKCMLILNGITSHASYAATAPFSLSCFFFYVGMFLARGGKISCLSGPESFFRASAHLSSGLLNLAPQFSQEAATLYWPAVYERGVALLKAGQRRKAIELLDRILLPCPETKMEEHLELANQDDGLKFRASIQKAIALLQLEAPEQAMAQIRQSLSSWGASAPAGDQLEAVRIWRQANRQARHMFGVHNAIYDSTVKAGKRILTQVPLVRRLFAK